MSGYRFRVEDGKLVLQVMTRSAGHYDCGYSYAREPEWRDAKVEDIPVSDPFGRLFDAQPECGP